MGKYGYKFRTIVVLFSTWVMLLAGFFIYDKYYVRSQEEYFRERGFRILGTLESELDSILEQSSDSIRSALKLIDPQSDRDQTFRAARVYFNTYLNKAQAAAAAESNSIDPAECDATTLKWIANPGLTFKIRCSNLNVKVSSLGKPQVAKAERNSIDPAACNVAELNSTVNPGSTYKIKCSGLNSGVTILAASDGPDGIQHRPLPLVTLKLGDWVRTSFENLDSGYFDDVLIADSVGNVQFQMGISGLKIRHLDEMAGGVPERSSLATQFTSDRSATQTEANHSPADTDQSHRTVQDFRELSQATNVGKIFLDGEEYFIFTQPVTQIPTLDLRDDTEAPQSLILCGLIRASRFQSDSHRLSYSTLIWLGLVCVTIFSLSWPLFKLQYMNNKERFEAKHGWYLCLAILSAACSVTLMLLNASYVSRATQVTDEQLGKLADRMKKNVRNEVDLALYQLNELRNEAMESVNRKKVRLPPKPANPSAAREGVRNKQLCRVVSYLGKEIRENCPLSGNALKQGRSRTLQYPFFDFVLWADCDGSQLVKFTSRPAATPATLLAPFAFFKGPISTANIAMEEVLDRRSASEPDTGPPGCHADENVLNIWDPEQRHLEELISPNTGETLVVLSTPFTYDQKSHGDEKIAVQSMAFRPMSLIDPILPPHYSFVVIDDNCRVLFHAKSTRNLRENFCDESKNTTELLPWLKGNTDHRFDITYEGTGERAYLTQLSIGRVATERNPDNKIFLVFFREPGVDATKNVAVMLLCAAPLGIYFAVVLIIGFVYLAVRRSQQKNYPPSFVWPSPQKAGIYVQVLVVNSVMLILFRYLYPELYASRLLLLTIAVPLFAVFFTLWKLSSAYRLFGQFRQRTVLRWITGTVTVSAGLMFMIEYLRYLYLLHSSSSASKMIEMSGAYQDVVLFGMVAIFGLVGYFLSGSHSYLKEWTLHDRGGQVLWKGSLQSVAEEHYRVAYLLAGMSLIVSLAVVPSIGFFKISYDHVTKLSLMHDETSLSERLEQRRDRVRQYYSEIVRAPYSTTKIRLDGIPTTAWQDVPGSPVKSQADAGLLDRYDVALFSVECPPSVGECKSTPPPGSATVYDSGEPVEWIGKFVVALVRLPSNAFGSEIGKLAATSGTNRSNRWETYWKRVNTNVPELHWLDQSQFPKFGITPIASEVWTGMTSISNLILLLAMGVLFFWLLKIIENIFPPNRERPVTPRSVNWHFVNDIERNSLVLGRAQSGKTGRVLNLKPSEAMEYRDLRVLLSETTRTAASTDNPQELLVMDHFEFNIKDPKCNLERLKFVEQLLQKPDAKRIIVSSVDPLYFFADESSDILSSGEDMPSYGQLLDRWVHALGEFEKVSFKDARRQTFYTELRHFLAAHKNCGHQIETMVHRFVHRGNLRPVIRVRPNCQQFALWVYLECRGTRFLRTVGIQLLKEYLDDKPLSHESVVNIISSRADAHYHVIWSDLTQKERLVLYQLALDGWANSHEENIRAIEELERKGLIRRRLMYRVMNESFSRFVKSTEHTREIRELETEAGQSTWQALKLVLGAAGIGIFVWLLYAQADLFRIGLAYLAGIGALLTTAVNFLAGKKRVTPGASTSP